MEMTDSPPDADALAADLDAQLDEMLADADAELAARYPGARVDRQPVHTVYVPAHTLDDDPPATWGAAALGLLDEHGSTPALLAGATGVQPALVEEVLDRVRRKLLEQPIEDLRVDFEDGYGDRGDDREDADVARAAGLLRRFGAGSGGSGPFRFGARVKCLEAPVRCRGLRTSTLLVAALTAGEGGGGRVPAGFVVTLPKVTSVDQVEAFVVALDRLEQAFGLVTGTLRFEIQVETAQAILGADGRARIAPMLHAASGRCVGLHYGTYDYSAGLGIPASQQRLDHPAADHAKAVMQLAAAGTGVSVCDGSTNVLPVGDTEQVHAAWRLHCGLVRRSLDRGFYQGWDMHPGHLVSRYLATYAFFRAVAPPAARRLRDYLDAVTGGVMDEPATATALATALLRGVDCGAVDAAEATTWTGAELSALARLARRPVPASA
jgi:citrate lyase beta subunit